MIWKSVILFLSGLCLASGVQAQPDSLWSRTYGGGGSEYCSSVIQTTDGRLALAGSTNSVGGGGYDFWLMRTNADGRPRWSAAYALFMGDDVCSSLIQTATGGFALGGNAPYGSWDDFFLVWTDSAGRNSRGFNIRSNSDDNCTSLLQTANGRYVMAGSIIITGISEADFWLVEVTVGGDRASWRSSRFGGENTDQCECLIQTADGLYAMAGRTNSFGAGGYDIWMMRTNSVGALFGSHSFGGGGDEACFSIIQTEDGGFAMAGSTYSFGAGGSDYWLVRTDANGDSLWSRTFGGDRYDCCTSLIQTEDGGFAMAGSTYSFGAGGSDYWLVRTDANGDSLWSRTFGGDRNDFCNSLIQTSEGGFALAGTTESFGAGGQDFWLVKTGPDPVSVANDGNAPFPRSLSLLSPYPNPFNSSVSVGFRAARPGLYALDVIDPQGRSLGVISKGYQTAGDFRMIWRADGLPGGNYWLRLTDARGGQDVKPIMLVR